MGLLLAFSLMTKEGVKMRARLLTAAGLALLLSATLGVAPVGAAGPQVFATGLNNPRGLAFDEEGNLYVAEGGTGGTMSTVGQCAQVAFPVGPYSGGFTASIRRISPNGQKTVVASGLPSSQTGPALGSLKSGVADVVVRDDEDGVFALISGAGCSHGLKGTSNSIVRVNANGSTTMVANLSAFMAAHPVANPDNNPVNGDFEPDGTWYNMVSLGDSFYAAEPNTQQIVRVSRTGAVSRVIDFSVFFPGNTDWRGPTALTAHGRFLYTGTLTEFPIVPGKAQVFKVDPRTGAFSVFASNLTTILGLAFGEDGALFVLETNAAPGFPAPGNGRVVMVKGNQHTVIASGLSVPTGIAVGPDGNLFVSVNGYGGPPGAGMVVKIAVPHNDD
jgi:hypothetical protein